MADEPISEAEMKRVKRQLIAGVIFGNESVHDLANSIAQGVTINDLDFLKNLLPRILAVAPADVQRVVKTYLDPEKRVVVFSVPKGDGQGAAARLAASRRRAFPRRLAPPAAGGGDFPLKDVKHVELPNGLTLLLYEDHRLPIITAEAQLRTVNVYEPDDKLGVAALTGMLLQEGTTKHTGPEIADLIESVGGSLDLSSAGGTVKVLAPRSLARPGPAAGVPDAAGLRQGRLPAAAGDACCRRCTTRRRSRSRWRSGPSPRRSTARTRAAGRRWARSRRSRR